MSLRVTTVAVIVSILMWSQSPVTADELRLAQASGTGTEKAPGASEKRPGRAEGRAVQVKGTVAAVDKDAKTVTLKGPKGRTVTLDVQDPQKLEAIKVGDPVVATYMEAVAFEIKKPGTDRKSTRLNSSH